MNINQLFESAPDGGALIVSVKDSVSFTPNAVQLLNQALTLAETIEQVTNPMEQAQAVRAQAHLKDIITSTKKSIQAEVDRANDYRKRLWAVRDAFLMEAEQQLTVISTMVGDYQTLEQAKARAAEMARLKDLEELERKRIQARAEAKSHDELDAIDQEYSERSANLPIVEVNRAEGQRITQDWDITVTDIWALVRSHSHCVKVTPLIGEIKNLLRDGVKVAGIVAKPHIKADVRLNQKVVEV